MELLTKVLASIVRRVLLGAAVSVLAVLLAKGLIGVELRDEVLAWLSGDAVSWIVTSLIAVGGVGLTWLDKYTTKLKMKAASALPKAATDEEITAEAKSNAPPAIAPLVR